MGARRPRGIFFELGPFRRGLMAGARDSRVLPALSVLSPVVLRTCLLNVTSMSVT